MLKKVSLEEVVGATTLKNGGFYLLEDDQPLLN